VREYLGLSDLDLVQKIDALERSGTDGDATFRRFQSIRSDLSRIAWHSYADALGCDAGPISKTGVMIFPLASTLAERFLAALLDAPRTAMRPRDFSLGYMRTAPSQCEYMNICNEYREMTPRSLALLVEFLSSAAPTLEQNIGHHFRIASSRQFQLAPREVAADSHVDGWPTAIRKLFILPLGAGPHLGTTRFRQRDGKEFVLESNNPILVIFENSVVWHAPVTGAAMRPTLELDIVPAKATCLDPVDAGLAGWYPWFPTESGLVEGTRMAAAQCFVDKTAGRWLSRVRRPVSR
jgi:hypothetical protein